MKQSQWLLAAPMALLMVAAGVVVGTPGGASGAPAIEVQSLDGSGNNRANPSWGRVGLPYSRVAPTRYADGVGAPAPGPNSRYISNRIFNDSNQNLFSERNVTQWGNVWGQFLDHTFGLREAPGVGNTPDPSSRNIDFDNADPLEEFTNTLGSIPFTRSSIHPGT
ncbi:MAG TPA: peroxidase family protein, partial [Catenuloplanes sp.]